MRVASAFSGIGGFDLGFERAGMAVAWQSETDEAASRVLAHHWPEVANLGDVARIGVDTGHDGSPRMLASRPTRGASGVVDILCGGFPCQDLSVAGRRAGLSGERSGLFHEFARLADALRPRWVVIENVPGLLSSNDGRDMGVVVGTLADLGFLDLAYRVVDSLQLGVPQRRRRVFIVGCAGAGAGARQVLLECEGRPWGPPAGGEAGAGSAATLTGGSASGRGVNSPGRRQEDDVNLVAATLQGGGRRGWRVDAESAAGGHLVASALTASAGHHGHSSPRGDGSDNIVPVQTFRKSYNAPGKEGDRWRDDPYANTLNTFDGGEMRARDLAAIGARVRRLTPVECERLQGFPDGWTEPAGSDSARYRCLGNAVTVNVAEWLGGRIMAHERGELEEAGAA